MDIKKIRETFFNREFITFIIIGCINTLSSTVFSAIYSSLLGKVMAFVAGYATSMGVSYLLNSYFTFRSRLGLKKFIKFVISCMPNFGIQFVVVLIGVQLLNINRYIVYLAAAIIGVPVTFLILKVFVFIKQEDKLSQ